jgi:hypothetical protein
VLDAEYSAARAFREAHPIRLSAMIRDPLVRAAFERADRDNGEPVVVPANPHKPVLAGGATVEV